MLELTNEQCKELERRVMTALQDKLSQTPHQELDLAISQIAITATITTIREYEKMKADL